MGLALVISGIVCFILFGRWLLPRGEAEDEQDAHISEAAHEFSDLGEMYELRTPDEEGAINFYSRLIGWQPFKISSTEALEAPQKGEPRYTVWMMGWNQVGGMMKMSAQAARGKALWCPFIAVEDVDACVRKAVELGGQVLEEPFDIPNTGRFALLSDPQGASFGIGRPESEDPD